LASEQTIAASRSLASDRPADARARALRRHAPLVAVLALASALNTVALSQNGYANNFYAAGVKSMLASWHNFVFNSFDPGGLITIDKPPLALWAQVLSARVFGFSGVSLLLPQAIEGVLAVAVVYWIVARPFGRPAALAAALALAVFPAFVAVCRDNGPDPLLILLMTLACGVGLRAIDSGRTRTLLGCAALVGLAFNTKSLAAYVIVPGIATAYLLCAPGSLAARTRRLALAGAVGLAVSVCWMAFVDLTPASQRPYVGGSLDNSELSLAFEYNGLGRIRGQEGAHGAIPYRPGAAVVSAPAPVPAPTPTTAQKTPTVASAATVPTLSGGLTTGPGSWAGNVGPLRLLNSELGRQGGWLVPFALLSVLALLVARTRGLPRRRPAGVREEPSEPFDRRDRRLAAVLVLGGWFVVEAVVLSAAGGIVHPYYISALAPPTAAMVGAGAALFVDEGRRRRRLGLLAGLGVVALLSTVAAQSVLLERDHYLKWLPVALGVCALAVTAGLVWPAARPRRPAAIWRRGSAWALALMVTPLLVAPAAYAVNTWLAPVYGTFPAAGPHAAAGPGGVGLEGEEPPVFKGLVDYLKGHRATGSFSVLTVSSVTAAPLILMGQSAAALGGYGGTDPAVDGPRLAGMVARREARYVLLGGGYSERGGNQATAAVLAACTQVPTSAWGGPPLGPDSFVLFDCGGHEAALARADS
jgi:4-amino-4-deoxy-L-arabinose transferase-like glycosyltransferase